MLRVERNANLMIPGTVSVSRLHWQQILVTGQFLRRFPLRMIVMKYMNERQPTGVELPGRIPEVRSHTEIPVAITKLTSYFNHHDWEKSLYSEYRTGIQE